MQPIPDVPRLLELIREGRSSLVVNWALDFGLARHPEAARDFAAAALDLLERDPAQALCCLPSLNAARAWPRESAFAARLQALLENAPARHFIATLRALVLTAGADAMPGLLGYLEGEDLTRAGEAASLLTALPGGLAALLAAVQRNPALRKHIPDLPQLLVGPGWTLASVQEALNCLARRQRPAEEEDADEYWGLVESFGGYHYDCAEVDPDRAETWVESAVKECHPFVALDVANRITRALAKGKGSGAAEALRGATPRSCLAAPRVPDEPEAALARALVQVLWRQSSLRAALARSHPEWLCGLWTAALARLADQDASPAKEPSSASWPEVLEALRWPRAGLKREEEWIARAVSFGSAAIPDLAANLAEERPHSVRRSAAVLAAIPEEAALRALLPGAAAEEVEELPPNLNRELLARVDGEALREALGRGDMLAACKALEHWRAPHAAGDALVEPLLPHLERLLFADSGWLAFTEFVMSHPDPRFLPLVELWRPGEGVLGEVVEVLLNLYRPDDERLAQVRADGARLRRQIEGQPFGEILAGRYAQLRLRCRRCQAAYSYQLRAVFFNADIILRKKLPPVEDFTWIDDVVTCKRCGARNEYAWTEHGRKFFLAQAYATGLLVVEAGTSPTQSAIRPARVTTSVGDGLTFPEALERLEQRVAQEPDEPRWQLARANLLCRMVREDEALEGYNRLLARWPNHGSAAAERGRLLASLQRPAEALQDFVRAALDLKPSDPSVEILEEQLRGAIRKAARASGGDVPLEALEALDALHLALRKEEPPAADQDDPLRAPHDAFGLDGPAAPALLDAPLDEPEAEGKDEGDSEEDDEEDREEDDAEEYAEEEEDGEEGEDEEEDSWGHPEHEDARRRLARELSEKIQRYGRNYRPEREWDEALSRWLDRPASSAAFVERCLKAKRPTQDHADLTQFLEYLVHDWRAAPEDLTLAERFKAAEWPRLTHAEQAQLVQWLERRRRGLFEIEETDLSRHLTTLRDHLTQETFRIYDHRLAGVGVKGQLLLMAIYPCGDRLEIGGIVTEVPRHVRVPFTRWLNQAYEAWRAARPAGLPSSWPRFFGERAAEAKREMTRLCALPPIVVMPTGEPMRFGHAVYEVLDHRAALAALERWAALQYDEWSLGEEVEGETYTFVRSPGDPPLPFARPLPTPEEAAGRHVLTMAQQSFPADTPAEARVEAPESLGTVRLGIRQLEVSAGSSERLAYMTEQLRARLAGSIRHLRTREQEPDFVERTWRERTARGNVAPRPPSRSDLDEVSTELRTDHMRRWVDSPVPALAGKTPRQAAADPTLRPEVEALLRDFESFAKRGSEPDQERNRIAEVRRELGMA